MGGGGGEGQSRSDGALLNPSLTLYNSISEKVHQVTSVHARPTAMMMPDC